MASNTATFERWSVPAVMALVAIVGLIIPPPPSLKPDRPKGAETPSLAVSNPDVVEARLWEDPFTRVSPAPEKTKDGVISPVGDAAFELNFNATPQPRCVTRRCLIPLFVVTMPAGPDAERTERRLRDRYAVTMAFQRKGLVAVDGPQLEVIRAKRGTVTVSLGLQRFADESGESTCAVLWMPDEYWRQSATRISLNAWWNRHQLGTGESLVSVIGPATSGSLRALRNSITMDEPLRIYSPWATMSEDRMGKVSPGEHSGLYMRHVQRIVVDDDRLLAALVPELRLRRAHKSDSRVLVIAESDDPYSRALADSFREFWKRAAAAPRRTIDLTNDAEFSADKLQPDQKAAMEAADAQLNFLWYQRGIDGQLPNEDRAEQRSAAESAAKSEGLTAQEAIERPLGRGQLDYIRRSIQGATEQRSLLAPSHISAVIILGSDVYDKLLITRAMRDFAPDAIFATTDLDARFLHPRELRWTRNMIIATSFQLQTSERLQEGLPPFRDQYQTAAFAATLTALHDRELGASINRFSSWVQPDEPALPASPVPPVGHPLLIEIGAHGPISLNADEVSNAQAMWYPDTRQQIAGPALRSIAVAILLVIAVSLILTWFLRLSPSSKLHDHAEFRREFNRAAMCFGIPVAVIALMVAAAYFIFDDQELLKWSQGVSAWPTLLLHAVGIGACFFFVKAFFRQAAQLRDEADKTLGLHLEKRRAIVLERNSHGDFIRPWQLRYRIMSWNPILKDDNVDIDANLTEYVARANRRSRVVRALTQTTIVFFATLLAFAVFGSRLVPIRGDFSYWCAIIIGWLAILSTSFLIIILFDATRLCNRVLETLGQGDSLYPPHVLERFHAATGIRGPGAPSACDVTLIARLTDVVSKAIYFPVIVLVIHLISRDNIFDRWTWDIVLLSLGVLGAAALIISGWMLGRVATRTREKELTKLAALRRLALAAQRARTAEEQAKSKADTDRAIGDLDDATNYINAQQIGAFTNLLEQPWLRAALVLLGSLGISGSLDWLKFLPK